MSIQLSENESRVRYTLAQGVSQSVFAVPFEFFEDADLTVFVNSILRTEGADYTVSGGDGSTGNITFLVALVGASNGSIIEIVRRIPVERTTDFLPGADINRAALNQQLDTLTAMIADVNDKANRSLRISDSDFGLTQLPNNVDRRGKVLSFGNDGSVNVISLTDVDNAIIGANYAVDSFIGTGTTTVYTLSTAPGSTNNTAVYIDGVYQSKGNYIVSGNTLTFSTAPPLNSAIEIVIGDAIPSGVATTAAFVSYDQGGSGAVTRTVQSRLRDFVSVKDFGAVGDGVIDDTAAIQAAIDASDGVYFPSGTYRINSKISFSKSISIVGSDKNAAIIHSYVDDYAIEITYVAGNSTLLENLSIEYKGSGSNGAGVYYFGPTTNTFANLILRDFPQQAFHFVQAVQARMSNCTIINCGVGVDVDGGVTNGITLAMNELYIAGGTTGILFTNNPTSAIHLENCIFENLTTGISAPGGAGGLCVNCWFESCTNGIVMLNGSGFVIESATLPGTTNPFVFTYSGSVPFFEQAHVFRGSEYNAIGFGYRDSAHIPSAADAFENVLLNTYPEAFYINFNPGGVAGDEAVIITPGVYDIEFFGNVRNATTATQFYAMRLTKNGTEIPGSYVSGSLTNTVANAGIDAVAKRVIIELDESDVIVIQFASSSTDCVLDTNTLSSIPAAGTTSSCGITLRHTGIRK